MPELHNVQVLTLWQTTISKNIYTLYYYYYYFVVVVVAVLVCFVETRFLCVIALAVLVDQAGLELTEIILTLPPKCWD